MIVNFNATQLQNLNLKYCERCGNLWLRHIGSAQSICNPCEEAEVAVNLKGASSFLHLWSRLRAEAEA